MNSKTWLATLFAAAFVCLAGCGEQGADTTDQTGVDAPMSDEAPGTATDPTMDSPTSPTGEDMSGDTMGDDTTAPGAGTEPGMDPADPNATDQTAPTDDTTGTPPQ